MIENNHVTMAMESVQVRFPEEALERIDRRVEDGEYPSRSEYIRDAVRTVEALEALRELRSLLDDADVEAEDLLERGSQIRESLVDEMFPDR